MVKVGPGFAIVGLAAASCISKFAAMTNVRLQGYKKRYSEASGTANTHVRSRAVLVPVALHDFLRARCEVLSCSIGKRIDG